MRHPGAYIGSMFRALLLMEYGKKRDRRGRLVDSLNTTSRLGSRRKPHDWHKREKTRRLMARRSRQINRRKAKGMRWK